MYSSSNSVAGGTNANDQQLFENTIRIDKTDNTVGINVGLPHQGIRDIDLPAVLQYVEGLGPAVHTIRNTNKNSSSSSSSSTTSVSVSNSLIPINLSLEMNFISDAGLNVILETFLRWNTVTNDSSVAPGPYTLYYHLRRLRLHMNKITNKGCIYLAQYLTKIHHAKGSVYLPTEIHLSHNRIIGSEGVKELLDSVAKYYPRSGSWSGNRNFPVPLWIRLEANQIDVNAIKKCVHELGLKEGNGLRWCGLAQKEKRSITNDRTEKLLRNHSTCSPSFCVVNASLCGTTTNNHNLPWHPKCVQAHLPYFHEQRPASATASSLENLIQKRLQKIKSGSVEKIGKDKNIKVSVPVNYPVSLTSEDLKRQRQWYTAVDNLLTDEPITTSNPMVPMEPVRAVPPPVGSSPSPSTQNLLIILDTSAVVRMMEANSSFSFYRLGLANDILNDHKGTLVAAGWPLKNASSSSSTASSIRPPPLPVATDNSVTFLLLETVLQQLDDNKKLMRNTVNAFMRLYPVLESNGSLFRLLSEDAEDRVRSGGLHVCTSPGVRLPDGKFDSDGLIIDASLVVLRSVLHNSIVTRTSRSSTTDDLSVQPTMVVLLTGDVRMRNRGREAGLPSVLWEDFEPSFGHLVHQRKAGLTMDSVFMSFPKDCVQMLHKLYNVVPNTDDTVSTPTGKSEAIMTENSGEGWNDTVAGRIPHIELMEASSIVRELVHIIERYMLQHNSLHLDTTISLDEAVANATTSSTGITNDPPQASLLSYPPCSCSLCDESKVSIKKALQHSHVWKIMHNEKISRSSLHAALYQHGHQTNRLSGTTENHHHKNLSTGTTRVASMVPPPSVPVRSDDKKETKKNTKIIQPKPSNSLNSDTLPPFLSKDSIGCNREQICSTLVPNPRTNVSSTVEGQRGNAGSRNVDGTDESSEHAQESDDDQLMLRLIRMMEASSLTEKDRKSKSAKFTNNSVPKRTTMIKKKVTIPTVTDHIGTVDTDGTDESDTGISTDDSASSEDNSENEFTTDYESESSTTNEENNTRRILHSKGNLSSPSSHGKKLSSHKLPTNYVLSTTTAEIPVGYSRKANTNAQNMKTTVSSSPKGVFSSSSSPSKGKKVQPSSSVSSNPFKSSLQKPSIGGKSKKGTFTKKKNN